MSFDELKVEVEASGNVLTVSMERLRDAHGVGKLGVHVCREISNQLAGRGLGHVPIELPSYQEKQVRVYKLGTDVAEIIRAVVEPSPEGDSRIRDLSRNGGSQYLDVIEKIRQLVAE